FSLPNDIRVQELIDQGHPRLDDLMEVASKAYMRTYRLHSARYCLDAWVKYRPDDLEARLRRGWVLERLSLMREAEQDYREALKWHPGNRDAGLRLGQILLLLNDPAEAVEILERINETNPSPPVTAALASGLRTMGNADRAYDILTATIA